MDWVAAMDQTSAALKTHAAMLSQFRLALIKAGFAPDEAADLIAIWYEYSLAQAAAKERYE